ncbi:MAG: DGQHR domain-containing protein [Methanomassiliicoccales archaeon]|nr:MAG: DGQHR domain-containing protein [Methanomassiliicoccales archaeon]
MAVLKSALKYEAEVRKFLKTLGFKHVDGGEKFKLGGVQIDACGGFDDTLLIIDCHTTFEERRKSIRAKIIELRGIRETVRRGLKKRPPYQKYKKIKLILSTKNIIISNRDKKFASQAPQVFLWTKDHIDYYRRLYEKIGEYARMELLGEIGVKPQDLGRMKYKVHALRTRLRNRTAYLFYADPEMLLRISYVARREVGRESYYQRILKRERLNRIAQFLDDDKKQGYFANNIIISFRKKPRFSSHGRSGTPEGLQFGWLHFPKEYRSAWIVDGQHRLYGIANATKAKRKIKVPVLAFHNLPEPQQAELFLTINKEQRPVNPNLLWDLEGEIHPNTPVGIVSRVVKKLNRLPPLEGRIFIPLEGYKKKEKHLNIANLCDGIDDRQLTEETTESMPKTSRNPLYKRSTRRRVEAVSQALADFHLVVASVFKEDWKKKKKGFFFTNNGLNVMLRVYEHMVVFYKHAPTTKEIESMLKLLKKYYSEKYSTPETVGELRKSCSSEAVRGKTADKFMVAIGRVIRGFAAEKVLEGDEAQKLTGFEAEMRTLVSEKLRLDDEKKWKARVPDKVRRRTEGKAKPDEPPWKELTLGECLDIIRRRDNWSDCFEKIFIAQYGTKTKFLTRFEELMEFRNKVKHDRDLRERERDLLSIYLAEMRECILPK